MPELPEVETIVRQVQENPTISLTSNEYVGQFDYMVTNELPNA